MIEAGIDEVQRFNGHMPCRGEMIVAAFTGSNAMRGPEPQPTLIEDGVPLSFEGGLSRGLPDQKSHVFKPVSKMDLFRLSLGVSKAGDCGYSMLHKRSMRDEGHIRAAAFRMENTDIGMRPKRVKKLPPLGKCAIPQWAMKIASHPGIDDVIDVIPLRRTHQVGWSIEVRKYEMIAAGDTCR